MDNTGESSSSGEIKRESRYSWPRRSLNLLGYGVYKFTSLPLRRHWKLLLAIGINYFLLRVSWENQLWFRENSAFVNFLLTYALFTVTTVYVYLTWKIVILQREAHRDQTRPLLYTQLERAEVPSSAVFTDNRVKFTLIVKNIGAGSAMDLQVRYYGKLLTSGKTGPYVVQLPTVPILASGQVTSHTFDLTETSEAYTHVPVLNTIHSFAQIEFLFHDAARGFFLYKQDYSYFKAMNVRFQRLYLESETLWYIPLGEADITSGDGLWYLAHERKPVFSRGPKQTMLERIRNIMDWNI